MTPPRLLVANRGEIAVRILSTARELNLYTLALFTPNDDAHTSYAHESVALPSAASYTDINMLVALCKHHHIDLVHPGYGFLSESPDFSAALTAAGITFVGPNSTLLHRTGDKLRARQLAQDCIVPILPGLSAVPDDDNDDGIQSVQAFAQRVGLPVMLKAVDGGGGRGIRLVRDGGRELEACFRAVRRESPSGQVFVEKAAGAGFRHVEVQILGDGQGGVWHFGERECSIQRRFQKVVEVAPSTIQDRQLVQQVIDAAVRMAERVQYASLGTWEFLVSPEMSKFYFMEINPRLQVEHTVTEAIHGVDLVWYQLLLALGKCSTLSSLGLEGATIHPKNFAIQLRIAGEDPQCNFSSSIGRIRQAVFPGGNGIRVDTHLRPGVIVTSDFDSLLAKVIVVGSDWTAAVAKAERALEDVVVDGVSTNVALLQGILRTKDFHSCHFDIQWLERELQGLLSPNNSHFLQHANSAAFKSAKDPTTISTSHSVPSEQLVRKGDIFNVKLEGPGIAAAAAGLGKRPLKVTSVSRNDFPNALSLKLSTTEPNTAYSLSVEKQTEAQQTAIRGQETSSTDPSLLVCPLAGQLVEILVDDGDIINDGEAVAIVRQMKMELEVRAHRSGVVKGLFDHDEGDEVSVGTVICSIVPENREKL